MASDLEREGERRLVVSSEEAGGRLDVFLARHLQISRRRATASIEAGRVRVGGRRGRKGDVLREGQVVIATAPADLAPIPQPGLGLQIRFEDDAVLVVDKPSGWPTHPLLPGELGTLANAVVAHAPSCAEAGEDPREGGACHSLDTPTSGLVIFAKAPGSWAEIRAQFSARTVDKAYLALVHGALDARLVLDAPIGRIPGRPGVLQVDPAGSEAHTVVEPLLRLEEAGACWTLVRCTITTGVMHQIRVHLSSVGHPVAGDERYGGPAPRGLSRLFLHGATLGFVHPASGVPVRLTSPLPDDLTPFLRRLGANVDALLQLR